MQNLINNISSNPYVSIVNLGTTQDYNLNITRITITNPSCPNNTKSRIYNTGQQHANEETQGSWLIESMIYKLLNYSTDVQAQNWTCGYIYHFVPIVNVNGVYSGTGRKTPVYQGTVQYDPNRQWDNARTTVGAENQTLTVWLDVNTTIGASNLNSTNDYHGSINGDGSSGYYTNYQFTSGTNAKDTAMIANISVFLEYNYGSLSTGTSEGQSVNFGTGGLGILPSINEEHTVNNISSTHAVNQSDYKRYGIEYLEAFEGYYHTGQGPPAATDCTYGGSGNWNCDCNQYNVINVSYSLPANKFTTNGTGSITLSANLTAQSIWMNTGCPIMLNSSMPNLRLWAGS
jgi:hypothetical protein